ncbi:hypothetical protein NL676_038304 [Syzygium grande]|nr:hypothetical protein NL676_038304 [Syzygium grande]
MARKGYNMSSNLPSAIIGKIKSTLLAIAVARQCNEALASPMSHRAPHHVLALSSTYHLVAAEMELCVADNGGDASGGAVIGSGARWLQGRRRTAVWWLAAAAW